MGQSFKRKVFYIPGYDPIHPRRYRELYRAEAAAQAAISGYDIHLSAKTGPGGYGWFVDSEIDGRSTRAEFEVMLWSDLVRASMRSGILATYGQMVRTAYIYIASGALWRLMQLRKGPVIAALYPVVMLIGQAAVAVALAYAAGAALSLWHPGLFWLGLVVIPWVLMGFRRYDNRLFAYYLMHDYAYSAAARGANPSELEARLAQFATRVVAALRSDVDEVLLVGHSSGAHLAISLLADIERSGAHQTGGPALSFLSLGQVVPMVSFLPNAHRLRRDLRHMSAQQANDPGSMSPRRVMAVPSRFVIRWLSPVWPRRIKNGPSCCRQLSARPLSAEKWRALKRRFFRLHFQYICAFDRPADYDYFQITAGPLTLGARYKDRAPSPGKVTRAVSKYRQTCP
jgi:hypothetical protein